MLCCTAFAAAGIRGISDIVRRAVTADFCVAVCLRFRAYARSVRQRAVTRLLRCLLRVCRRIGVFVHAHARLCGFRAVVHIVPVWRCCSRQLFFFFRLRDAGDDEHTRDCVFLIHLTLLAGVAVILTFAELIFTLKLCCLCRSAAAVYRIISVLRPDREDKQCFSRV